MALNGAATTMRDVAHRVDLVASGEKVQAFVNDAGEAARQLRITSSQLGAMSGQLRKSQNRLDALLDRERIDRVSSQRGPGLTRSAVERPSFYRNSDSLVMELRALVADVKKNPRRYLSFKIF